jgi:hypothetical protein
MGVDYIFYKRQADYNPDMVINTLLTFRQYLSVKQGNAPIAIQTDESPEKIRQQIIERIDKELENIGIGVKYKGRAYLQEAILLLIAKDKDSSETVIHQVAKNQKTSYNNVQRAMQTAINSAWHTSSIDDLLIHYKARININTGIPTSTEFIHYYADKITKSM